MHHQRALRRGRGLTLTPEVDAGTGAREINALLSRLGLGTLISLDEPESLPGRNHTWAGTTSMGQPVVVKQFRGAPEDAGRRFARSLAFEQMARGTKPSRFATPRCLGWDEQARLLAFEYVEAAKSGADLALSAEFGDDIAYRVGLAIGELHAMPARAGSGQSGRWPDRTAPRLPSAGLLDGLPRGVYAACSAAELQAWSLMQHDRPLAGAIGLLLTLQEQATATPAHCDLRLEQVLLGADSLYLCDWEEFRVADPARDVGSFAGEWLHQAITTMAASDGDADALSHAEILRRITAGIERNRPRIVAFWAGYRHARPAADLDLAIRAAAFAGWHMFDRMLAVARRFARLRAIDRAAAGVGRTILLSPATYVQTLGLEA
ncbi:MAG TPA: class V lanthionine synthetase subunit LxmK [Streptosporangiaceae bacterium]|nr:class V lanthionine synthetase subunit LxmK [Streptosporangiaceae bacterium]